MTPSPDFPNTFTMSPAHSFNGLLGTVSPPHTTFPFQFLFHAHSFPHFFQGQFLHSALALLPPSHTTPPGPGLSHLLAKRPLRLPGPLSATAPVSTVLTEAQFPSRRRAASSRAPSLYRAVNSACGREGSRRERREGRSGRGEEWRKEERKSPVPPTASTTPPQPLGSPMSTGSFALLYLRCIPSEISLAKNSAQNWHPLSRLVWPTHP